MLGYPRTSTTQKHAEIPDSSSLPRSTKQEAPKKWGGTYYTSSWSWYVMVLLWKEMKRNSTSGLHQHPLLLQSRHLGESISIHFRFIRIDTKHWGPWHTAQQQHLSEWCLQSHMLLGVAICQLNCTSGWHVSILSPTNFSYCKHQTKHPITEKLKKSHPISPTKNLHGNRHQRTKQTVANPKIHAITIHFNAQGSESWRDQKPLHQRPPPFQNVNGVLFWGSQQSSSLALRLFVGNG